MYQRSPNTRDRDSSQNCFNKLLVDYKIHVVKPANTLLLHLYRILFLAYAVNFVTIIGKLLASQTER